jgi:hypothetical protein
VCNQVTFLAEQALVALQSGKAGQQRLDLLYMNASSHQITWFTIGSTVSLSMMTLPAQAQSTGTAADLLPLNAQEIPVDTVPDQLKALQTDVSTTIAPEATYSPDLLRAVASNINSPPQQDELEDVPDIGDFIDLSFVEQFIDENGNVDLPLGITIYEAMGQTSIGFGGDFR